MLRCCFPIPLCYRFADLPVPVLHATHVDLLVVLRLIPGATLRLIPVTVITLYVWTDAGRTLPVLIYVPTTHIDGFGHALTCPVPGLRLGWFPVVVGCVVGGCCCTVVEPLAR